MNTKVIVFDAYGTLFDINSLDELLLEYFGDKSTKMSYIWRKKQLEYTWLRTLMDKYKSFSSITVDALKYACAVLQVELTAQVETHLLQEYLKLVAFAGVPEALVQLGKKTRMAVLSNADQHMLEGAIAHNGLEKLFARVLSADDIQLFKPRSEVYQMATDAFKVLPPEILFVSSNTWDVAGAKSYGMQVAWLNRAGTVREQLDQIEDRQLLALSDLHSSF